MRRRICRSSTPNLQLRRAWVRTVAWCCRRVASSTFARLEEVAGTFPGSAILDCSHRSLDAYLPLGVRRVGSTLRCNLHARRKSIVYQELGGPVSFVVSVCEHTLFEYGHFRTRFHASLAAKLFPKAEALMNRGRRDSASLRKPAGPPATRTQ